MQRSEFRALTALAAAMGLLAACVQTPTVPPSQPQPGVQPPVSVPAPEPEVAAPPVVEAPAVPRIDTMADVPGDNPLPALAGAYERMDCTHGGEDLHARMAFEARGGRVVNFAYYSKWKPRTCAFDFSRTSPGTKWRLTPDGATRVHTPEGRFLIRTMKDAYVFEFEQVQRGRYCGMPGSINGSMTVKRFVRKPDCSVSGIMDANDTYLDALYKGKLK
jgi:hypothetical protein